MSASQITVITTYTAQVRVYRSALEKMNQNYRNLQCSQLEVANVSGYNGKEHRIIILDLHITKSPFTNEKDLTTKASPHRRNALGDA